MASSGAGLSPTTVLLTPQRPIRHLLDTWRRANIVRVLPTIAAHFEECVHLPRGAVRFPIELRPPANFRPDDPATWPAIDGCLEYVGGRLLYMPPCGDIQQDVCTAVVGTLFAWVKEHRDFVVGSNEAGMIVKDEVRGADAAVWRRSEALAHTGKFRRSAPVLAVEVAGLDEDEAALRHKARWYLEAGVQVVWLVLPDTREVVVAMEHGDSRYRCGSRLPAEPSLPGLAPEVADLFVQLDV
jgi:Uma2 family endonuclease